MQLRLPIIAEQIDLVPDFEDVAVGGERIDAEVAEHFLDVVGLRLRLLMRDVADVQDQVGLDDFFKRGAKRGDQHRRQVRDEADGVGQNNLAGAGQFHFAHGGIERREYLVHGQHAGAGDFVEQRRLAGVGVADDGDNRIRHLAPALAVQFTRFDDLFEIALDGVDAVLQHALIKLDLGFARAAEKAAAAALALQMGPGAHQAALLVREMRELDLQHAFFRACAGAEDFKDQSRAIDDLGVPDLLQVALLDRGNDMIDDDEADFLFGDLSAQFFDLTRSEQR